MATLEEYVGNNAIEYEASSLFKTYSYFTPRSAQEAILEDIVHPLYPLCRMPPRVAGHEWMLTRREVKRALNGAPPRWMFEGKRVFGPIAREEGASEFTQLIAVYESVRRHGLQASLSSDPIRGYFLVRDDEFRFVLTGGQHRVAALRVLGVTELTAVVDWLKAIHEDELTRWCLSEGGPYPLEVVQLIFDKLFDEQGLKKARNLGLLS